MTCSLKGRGLLENSTLSMDVDHTKLGVDPKVVDSKERSNDQMVEPVVRQKFAKIRENYRELRLAMEGGYAVVFRAIAKAQRTALKPSLPESR